MKKEIRLIDANALKIDMCNICSGITGRKVCYETEFGCIDRNIIDRQPTIQPEKKHGYIRTHNAIEYCSECGKSLGVGYCNYCGYCGAELEYE